MTKGQNPRRPSRRKALRAIQNSGLIANEQTRKRAVGTKSALDNRSHRTNAEPDKESSELRWATPQRFY
jgi:hypothetical protein